MNLIRKGHGHKHRGVVGIESAIVLIAFVIVAAALAFVVLNMGFATSQKAKTAIVATLGEALAVAYQYLVKFLHILIQQFLMSK